jgi:hypothetical protein
VLLITGLVLLPIAAGGAEPPAAEPERAFDRTVGEWTGCGGTVQTGRRRRDGGETWRVLWVDELERTATAGPRSPG